MRTRPKRYQLGSCNARLVGNYYLVQIGPELGVENMALVEVKCGVARL